MASRGNNGDEEKGDGRDNPSCSTTLGRCSGSDDGPTSSQGAGPQNNTVEIGNLPPNTSKKELLDRITLAGPFGGVYNINVRDGKPTATALLAFFSKKDCRLFKAYVTSVGILVNGSQITARLTSQSAPESIEAVGPNDSRVLLFKTTNEDHLRGKLLQNGIDVSDVQIIQPLRDRGRIAVAFTSYAIARQVLDSITGCIKTEPKTIKASYGADPISGGITKIVEYIDGQHRLGIDYEDFFLVAAD